MKAVGYVLLAFVGLFAICTLLGVFGLVTGFFSNGSKVVQKEFYPEALLKKYEWFKDAGAMLDKKRADISVYDARMSDLVSSYDGETRKSWAREDREQWNLWTSELAGIRASYNDLAAQYNSQMAKFNWRFTNVGDLPPGAITPLPREYKPYEVR